ncbi:OLC1v1009588C1 [Oldenlandia corymbosa var. corymbosa]|uniref:Defective in cullin neddylation protein n=1 Tax=Oldenlandia corymbosa var. corymbosa TaxID=529605 RepID=A0AAV1DPA0_OLDCO|nr:OLC1v1009588C1 [Oldenlandia corymbosa var. corymbosa]
MEPSFVPDSLDIFEIYRRYCDIMSGLYNFGSKGQLPNKEYRNGGHIREALTQLLTLVESRPQARYSIMEEIYILMMRLDLRADFSEFSRFYDFVFFICRENGQKNITVSRAVMAWRLVLAGRFRLLNDWCNFIEENQRHNISEDTWRQVLAFSRCVQDNLEGYDPEGAWPILIDEFVEHMYRVRNNARSSFCSCNDIDAQPVEDSLTGLERPPGMKRKSYANVQNYLESSEEYSDSNGIRNSKRVKMDSNDISMNCDGNGCGSVTDDCMEMTKQSNPVCCTKSPCAVEGCLSKGFAGLFSFRPCLQYRRDREVSST